MKREQLSELTFLTIYFYEKVIFRNKIKINNYFYTIFQRDRKESGIEVYHSNNSNPNRYTRNKSNNSNRYHLNTISNTKKINYVKNIKNKNNIIRPKWSNFKLQ